jgi:UDPglucose 6-dehydrogenase
MTDPASAETLKYAANGFLALKLTYINSIAAICDAYGADIRDVVKGLSFDPRIGGQFFNPGPGWGGSCFPKDTRALTHISEQGGYDFRLLKTAIEANDLHQQSIVDKIISSCDGDVRGKVIAVWGLTFKANTDDIRDSPAIVVIKKLLKLGARMQCFDPSVSKVPTEIEGSLLAETALEATTGASALILLTEWAEFASVKPRDVFERMSSPRVVDARNLLDRESWQEHGFIYRGIGR